ncbi:MAG: ferritin-like domain-containing protein [Cyclobacteriaceae bacterium]|nr:ferritin-like domain-containing protein [Cyclobacteriaceae bacterium]
MGRTKIESFSDLFVHELKDLYSAESQLIEALPKMAKAASSQKLVDAYKSHFEETKKQKERLERIAEMLGVDVKGETCEAMKGLIKEGEDVIEAKAPDNLKDAALIAAAQRVEHYEMAGYGTAVYFADMLQEHEVSDLLAETLDEEKAADSKLNKIAMESINQQAAKHD